MSNELNKTHVMEIVSVINDINAERKKDGKTVQVIINQFPYLNVCVFNSMGEAEYNFTIGGCYGLTFQQGWAKLIKILESE